MSQYGTIKTTTNQMITLYKNFWLLLIRNLPEPLWCKVKLNRHFNELINQSISKDHVLILAKRGKVESLRVAVCFADAYFREICESNLLATKYMVRNYQIPFESIQGGVISAWRARKSKIASFLIQFINKDISPSEGTKVVSAYVKTFLVIFDKINMRQNRQTLFYALTMFYDYVIKNKWFVIQHTQFRQTLHEAMLLHIGKGFDGMAQYVKIF